MFLIHLFFYAGFYCINESPEHYQSRTIIYTNNTLRKIQILLVTLAFLVLLCVPVLLPLCDFFLHFAKTFLGNLRDVFGKRGDTRVTCYSV